MNDLLKTYIRELVNEAKKENEERVDEFCGVGGGAIAGFTAPMGFVGGRAPKKRKKKRKPKLGK